MTKVVSFLSILIFSNVGLSAELFESQYRLKWRSRWANHLLAPGDLASFRNFLFFEQKAKWRQLSFMASVRGYSESAFAHNSRFGSSVREAESYDVAIRDSYAQWKYGEGWFKVGVFQDAWGEAFGFYFADLVNPKDMREAGINDLAESRITVPIVQWKHFFGKTALEVVYLPRPTFNQVGAIGGDFAFPYAQFFPGYSITIESNRLKPWLESSGEWGVRLSSSIRGIDFSLLGFDYFDRNPNYDWLASNVGTPSIVFREVHQRIKTLGLTAAADFLGGFVIRSEVLFHLDKRFDETLVSAPSHRTSNEWVAVVGIDKTSEESRLGVQVSLSQTTQGVYEVTFPSPRRELLTLWGSQRVWSDHKFELNTTYAPRDGSGLIQARYLLPISKDTECSLGVDRLFGGAYSAFGQFQNGSRYFINIESFLDG